MLCKGSQYSYTNKCFIIFFYVVIFVMEFLPNSQVFSNYLLIFANRYLYN